MTTASVACRQLVELITDYLEDTLPPARRRAVQAHLDACGNCLEYLAQMRQVIALNRDTFAARPGLDELPPALLDIVLEAYRQRTPPT